VTKIQIELPDDVAERASSAGLLSSTAMQGLLEDAIRRQAGRRLLDVAGRIQAAGVEPMSPDEIDAEVKAYRAENRSR
jgi:hypothetical protein